MFACSHKNAMSEAIPTIGFTIHMRFREPWAWPSRMAKRRLRIRPKALKRLNGMSIEEGHCTLSNVRLLRTRQRIATHRPEETGPPGKAICREASLVKDGQVNGSLYEKLAVVED